MAENDVNRLIDMLYERVEDAKSPALKPNLSMVDRDEVLDLLDELRNQLPVELKRAQELLAAREKFVDEAKRDVERMMRQADLEAKSKVSDSEVLYAAKEKARKIIADAEDRSRQLCQVANEYAEDALARTEEAVQAALSEVKQSRTAFRAASAAKLQEQRDKLEGEKKPAEQAQKPEGSDKPRSSRRGGKKPEGAAPAPQPSKPQAADAPAKKPRHRGGRRRGKRGGAGGSGKTEA